MTGDAFATLGMGAPAWAASAPVAAGVIAGVLHVLSGPDHLAAVAPLAVNERRRGRRAWMSGLWWGVGHSSGVWFLALLALLFRELIPIDLISGWSERLVGFVLLGVGLWALRSAMVVRIHAHEHTHDGETHRHVHAHAVQADHARPHAHQAGHAGHSHAPLGIGLLHGLAGTSHLVGVLPSLLMPTRLAAASYVAAYGLGSISAMTGFAHVLGLLLGGLRGEKLYRRLLGGTGLAAIGVGVWWIMGM
ncbi:MAG: nickel transporter [Phycisphaeraceae bacterium]|nr:MAG: nickel transporter [Phycisphaeraceae bacterium]